jgi:hypothetical protein
VCIRPSKVGQRGSHSDWILLKQPYRCVAGVAKKTAHLSRFVVVVNVKVLEEYHLVENLLRWSAILPML